MKLFITDKEASMSCTKWLLSCIAAAKRFLARPIIRKCLLIICSLIIVVAILFFSCDSFKDKALDAIIVFFSNTVSCEYEVAFDFERASDRSIIEKRLENFNFEIIRSERSGSSWIYTLERYNKADSIFFDAVATSTKVELVDKAGKVALTKSDIISMRTKYENIVFTVKDDCYKRFSKDGEPQVYYFSNGKERVYANCFYDDNNVLEFFMIEPSAEEEILFIEGIVNLISTPLSGKVDVEVLNETVRFK